MATAAKTPPSSPLPSMRGDQTPPRDPLAVRAFDAAFRFFASLKLAVISLLSLAGVLAYATFFEKWYGTAAVQEWIYRSPGFSILLAFLGMNILCAALIRYPWTKRQTGFVITHAGLLVVLLGSWISVKVTLTGQEGMVEGDQSSQLVLTDDSAIRVQELDPETGHPTTEYQLPFFPGTFAWEGEKRRDVLTTPAEPFRIVVTKFYPASTPPYHAPVAGPGGQPMIKAGLYIKPPRSDREIDIFSQFDESGTGERRWLKADDERLRRDARELGPALLTFQYATTPEMVEDFLALPDDPLKDDLIRVRYRDRGGKDRLFPWPADAKPDTPVALPDSDLSLTLTGTEDVPLSREVDPDGRLGRRIGDDALHLATFKLSKAGGPPQSLMASSNLPAVPNDPGGRGGNLGVRISYYHPPHLGGQAMQGRSSVIDILGTQDGKLYYRAFSREGLRGKGPIEPGRRVKLVEGPNQPVAFSFQVDQYLLSGIDEERVDPLEMPAGQKDQGVPAALCEMTVGGETKEYWLRRPGSLEPTPRTVRFAKGTYRLSFDFERKELPFSLKLLDFDVGTDPGTSQASSYVSEVLLDDPQRGVEDRPVTITMNEPLTWRHYTFYQSNYQRQRDPQTGRPTGRFVSIFQVRYDPPWCWGTVYLGCALVVLGTFVQFYMRAGVFSDGGKKERERAERREARREGKKPPRKPEPDAPIDDEPL